MKAVVERWRRDPVRFVTECLRDPETGKPFTLYAQEVDFLRRALTLTREGRLPFPELLFSAPKKSGKTALAAMIAIYVAAIIGGRWAEVYCLANDFEQSSSRVWEACRRMVEASPFLSNLAKVAGGRLTFRSTGSFIQACASDYSGFAGSNPSLTIFDELWGYISENARRLFDESAPSPTRKVSARLTVSYAGYVTESDLLESLYKRALAGESLGPDLYRAGGMLAYWTHDLKAPWQNQRWLDQMREASRPNAFARLYKNEWVTAEESFLSLAEWDSITDPVSAPIFEDRNLAVFAGCDASVKHDSTSIVAVAWKRGGGPLTPRGIQATDRLRLIDIRTFQPSPDRPLDFESTVERVLLDWHSRYHLKEVRFDPYQMAATAQRLRRSGINIVEYPQSLPNLSAMAANLYELVRSRTLSVFSDEPLRRAAAQAIAVESARGWKIDKSKQSHKIDPIIALCMACLSAVEGKGVFPPPRMFDFFSGEELPLGALHEHDLPTWDVGFITPWGTRVSDEVNHG